MTETSFFSAGGYTDRLLANLDAAHERGDLSTADYLAAERSILEEANEREFDQ